MKKCRLKNYKKNKLISHLFCKVTIIIVVWEHIYFFVSPVPVWQHTNLSDQSEGFQKKWMQTLIDMKTKPCIRGILRQFSNLYPVMRSIVNLDSYMDVTSKLSSMMRAFHQPFSSTRY